MGTAEMEGGCGKGDGPVGREGTSRREGDCRKGGVLQEGRGTSGREGNTAGWEWWYFRKG